MRGATIAPGMMGGDLNGVSRLALFLLSCFSTKVKIKKIMF